MKSILFLLLCLSYTVVHSQNDPITTVVTGQITDVESGIGLPGANVTVIGSDPILGAVTDADGYYRITAVPVGRIDLKASFLGFEPQLKQNLLGVSGKDLVANFELEEQYEVVEEVEIIAEENKAGSLNEMSIVSSRLLSTEEAVRFSGTLQDPARMAQNYAGVSAGNDARNDIVVRGNSPTGVLWRIDGVDVPSPNHFSTIGTTGGPISMLNINNLKNSSFLSSAWPAEYGNALSGVFDLHLRHGNRTTREYMAQVGFNGFEFGMEGPFVKNKNATYIANYRYSTLGFLDLIGLDLGTGDAIPQYQDLTFKVGVPTKNIGNFSFWGIMGKSHISFPADTMVDENNLFSDETQDSRFESRTGILGISHKKVWNEKTYSQISLAFSHTASVGKIDTVDLRRNFEAPWVRFDRTVNKATAKILLNKKINNRLSVRANIAADLYELDFGDSTRLFGVLTERSDFTGSALLTKAALQFRYRISSRLTATGGLYGQYFELSNSTSLEPRLGLLFNVDDKNSFNIGAGLHSQTQPLIIYFVKDPAHPNASPNEEIDFTKSLHAVLGYDRSLGANTRLKTEIYYQHLYNVPIDTFSSTFSMLNEGADFVLPNRVGLTNAGTGTNYGVELTLEQFLSKGFYYLFSASLFESKYSGSDNIERNTAFNTNYVVNFLAGKEFALSDKITLTFDTKVTTAGGRPYTPVDLESSIERNTEVLNESVAFSQRYPGYFRLDFKAGVRVNWAKVSQEFYFDIQNITNNQNVFLQGYKASTQSIATTYQRGFFPMAFYRLYF